MVQQNDPMTVKDLKEALESFDGDSEELELRVKGFDGFDSRVFSVRKLEIDSGSGEEDEDEKFVLING